MKKILITVAVLVLIGAGAYYFINNKPSTPPIIVEKPKIETDNLDI